MMKKGLLSMVVTATLLLSFQDKAHAQFGVGIVTGILKRIIMSIDLKVQREQTKVILFQDAQKQLENIMSHTRLAEIGQWVEEQKELYEQYYQELWEVKNALKYYTAIRNMIDKQARLLTGYKQAYAALVRDGHFTTEELTHMTAVYQGILRSGALAVDQLGTLINAFTTQMDDGDRLAIINNLSADIDRNYRQLVTYTQENILLSLQRSKDENDLNMIKRLYGIH